MVSLSGREPEPAEDKLVNIVPESETRKAIHEIAERIFCERPENRSKVESIKREIAKKYKLNRFLRNSEILAHDPRLREYLQVRSIRSVSGVNIISVMTAPLACRHGACIFCPGGPTWGTPMSYTGREPASMRAIQNAFDPGLQLQSRIEQLEATGHSATKLEIIVMGGTFNSTPTEYQDKFINSIYATLNRKKADTLELAKLYNGSAKYRCVGLTFETKPDWAKPKHILKMLNYGVTRVEIGVQNLHDEVLKFVNRGHTIQDTIDCFKHLRDAGLKITAHMMPGLPKSTIEMDIEDFRKLYEDPAYKPDEVKIYPTQVIENTPLAEMVFNGSFKPLTNEETFHIICEAKKLTPPWVRIKRALRDLPIPLVVAGPTWGNMRQRIQNKMKKLHELCRCIRCREVGQLQYKEGYDPNKDTFDLKIQKYEAGEGEEYFLSYETDEKVLTGFLRLRFPSPDVFIPELRNSGIVRELHVYGNALNFGVRDPNSFQHRGYGKLLMKVAERVTEESGYQNLAVISGVGVRDYYRKQGYTLDKYYMKKDLT